MIEEKHIRQASTEKVYGFTTEIFTQAMNVIKESNNYMNDIEQVMCVVLLSNVLLESSKEVIGEKSVELILKHLKVHKGEKDEREKNN